MFDSLRDSLDRFRSDVEDVAEVEEDEKLDDEEVAEDPEQAARTEPKEDDAESTSSTDEGEPDADGTDEDEREADEEGGTDVGLTGRASALARGRLVIDEGDLEGPLWDLEMALLGADVAMPVAEEILAGVEEELVGETRLVTRGTTSVVEDALREAMLSVLDVDGIDFDEYVREADKPVVIVFTGVNGVGKTTTIAKLSERVADRGFSSVLANGDTFRAGASEQLEGHAEALDRPIITHEQGGDPAAVLYDAVEYAAANDVDVVLGDTAGRLHTSDDLMDQLAKIDRVVDPDLTIFVDEAVAGQDAVERAREFNDAASIDGAILTKADADAQGGAAISVSHVTGTPILFLGTGQGYDDIEPFDPEALVDRLLDGA
ncbi:signal recognition particle-docking protein FtsY [Halovivax sp.]|uniref:signal recognition particle-docking protein FtsY n=1 Tax=Halovivax sp. TaxID=1935978 RepID=UPI0031B846F9